MLVVIFQENTAAVKANNCAKKSTNHLCALVRQFPDVRPGWTVYVTFMHIQRTVQKGRYTLPQRTCSSSHPESSYV